MKMNKYYEFGYNIFGPFLKNFTKWLYMNFKREKINKVLFFSRDGYMMKKAFDQCLLKHNCKIDSEYVYFSRNSIRRALLWKSDNYKDSLKYFTNCRFMTLSEILSYYGIRDLFDEDICKKYSLALSDEIEYASLERNKTVEKIYLDYKHVIDSKSKEQYELLKEYMHQIGIDGSNVAIVDIGWHGSMQQNLEAFMQENNMNNTLHAYYIGINPLGEFKGSLDGYIYNANNMKYRKKVLCFFGCMEKLFQSLEGSTKEYARENNIIVPVYEAYEYEGEKEITGAIRQWQNGALDYLKSDESVSNAEGIKRIMRFGMSPTLQEAMLFSFFYNTDGEKNYFIPQKKLFKYKPKEFLHAMSNSAWKTGFMKVAFKLPFPYYWIYALLRR